MNTSAPVRPCSSSNLKRLTWSTHGCHTRRVTTVQHRCCHMGYPWLTSPAGLIICAISGWLCFPSRILAISRVKAAGSSTNALASASGLSRTMAISISPPSFWMRAGRPACICARIATALFPHRVRSHSSRALCAKVPVCGDTFWTAGVPNARMKGLSGSVQDGRSAIAATARRMSPSLTS